MARDDIHVRRGESLTEWRARFDQSHTHLAPVERKEWLRYYLDAASQRDAIPAEVRNAVYDRDGRACLHCGATERLSLDHIHPYSLGGEDTIENLQTLCRPCNSRKGANI